MKTPPERLTALYDEGRERVTDMFVDLLDYDTKIGIVIDGTTILALSPEQAQALRDELTNRIHEIIFAEKERTADAAPAPIRAGSGGGV